jgi:hypothetical protein
MGRLSLSASSRYARGREHERIIGHVPHLRWSQEFAMAVAAANGRRLEDVTGQHPALANFIEMPEVVEL